jgi:uncharacterized circularly permuted ATP-grasp superfamily protein/uncharacterized alpha-E superfamily protein
VFSTKTDAIRGPAPGSPYPEFVEIREIGVSLPPTFAISLTARGDPPSLRAVQGSAVSSPYVSWGETHESSGAIRPEYQALIDRLRSLPRQQIRALDERLEATMREMGVTFDISRDKPWGRRPWFCDLLPQIFRPEEWEHLEAGIAQRIEAFELFLQDIYGPKEILRSNLLPIQPVLGSVFYQRPAASLTPPDGAYLHLSGLSLCRLPSGEFAVKHHYLSNASGISYMVQNRRALARVIPQSFQDLSIRSIAEATVDILESLRGFSSEPDPTVVLLSPGPGSAVYSEHSFLARRMGIPLVQGGDLLVLNDAVYLKTVTGLEKVEVIYTRVSDEWLDPLAFRRDSLLGIPGLVHCIRKGTVSVVNGIGSQLADDRALLPFANTIIRFYLGVNPLLRGLTTYWLGDIDQRELVLSDLEKYTIRPLYGERIVLGGDGQVPDGEALERARQAILGNPSQFIAQPQDCDAEAISFDEGREVRRRQDHIFFAQRTRNGKYDIFPGALTRVSTAHSPYTANELGGGSKDTWVQAAPGFVEPVGDRARPREAPLPSQHVSSRVAEAFYWIGRYVERAHNLAGMISVIEALELEELNPTERTLYRPVWNRILPPLENPGTVSRRNISSPAGRYRLALDLEEPDSIVQAVLRASGNAESILECLSLEAWNVLATLRGRFQRARFRPNASADELAAFTRRICDHVVRAVPEFFGTAQVTMVADGGWAFCEIGQFLERAIITGNAVCSIFRPMPRRTGVMDDHEAEIRLSAFLRLINSRDVYRRVYQMRIEPGPLLELLWKNPSAPRSVARCLDACLARVRSAREENSPVTLRITAGIETLIRDIRTMDWDRLLEASPHDLGGEALYREGQRLLRATLDIHNLISDGFLNHQIHMRPDAQPQLLGLHHAF